MCPSLGSIEHPTKHVSTQSARKLHFVRSTIFYIFRITVMRRVSQKNILRANPMFVIARTFRVCEKARSIVDVDNKYVELEPIIAIHYVDQLRMLTQ